MKRLLFLISFIVILFCITIFKGTNKGLCQTSKQAKNLNKKDTLTILQEFNLQPRKDIILEFMNYVTEASDPIGRIIVSKNDIKKYQNSTLLNIHFGSDSAAKHEFNTNMLCWDTSATNCKQKAQIYVAMLFTKGHDTIYLRTR